MNLISEDYCIHMILPEELLLPLLSARKVVYDVTSNEVAGICGVVSIEVDNNSYSSISVACKTLKRIRDCSVLDSNCSNPKVLKRPSVQQRVAKQQNVETFMKNLNIIPEISDDMQCAMCSYKATRKANLKVHVQLKHLGGIGVSVNCSICQQKVATKSNLKRHLISAHKLPSDQATKLIS